MLTKGLAILVWSLSLFTLQAQVLTFDDQGGESSAAFIYDGSQRSRTNQGGWVVDGPKALPTDLQPGSSFTLEVVAKPLPEFESRPRDFLAVAGFGGGSNREGVHVGIWRSNPPHSYNWWTTRCETGGERTDLAKNRYGGIGHVRKDHPWRHLALTWHAETRELTYYFEYRSQGSVTLEADPDWDLRQVLLGGTEELPFPGTIDEVRILDRVLDPSQFLRSSAADLKDVSFAIEESEQALPADYGHHNIKLHYGAAGDGKTDDTAAIQKAFEELDNRVPNDFCTVYFPPGTYLVSDTVRWSRFMVVRGAGKDKTRIVLQDNAKGYSDPEKPKPVVSAGYDWGYGEKGKRAGNVIGNYLFDLTVETGKGNPGAVGLDYHCNNVGCVENVDIRSGDGTGHVGLDFKRPWPGPLLVKNVAVEGFDYGIDAVAKEYSLVFSDITLKNQQVAAIRNRGNILSIENLVSDNQVPAILTGQGGLVTLLNSELRGGGDFPAITNENGCVYLRNVSASGYQGIVRNISADGEETIARTSVEEYINGPVDRAFPDSGEGSLKLPIRATPEIQKPAVTDWDNILDFQDRVSSEGDWTPAIQAAIDAGAPLLYFPHRAAKYRIDGTVEIRGSIRTFMGGSPDTKVQGEGQFRLAEEMEPVQFEMLGIPALAHESATDLVFRHGAPPPIEAQEGCGALFIEDAGGRFRFGPHQKVWARQLNPEAKGEPEIINDGGQLWILGLKTEYLSTKIENLNGARTELLGGLMYTVHPVKDETLPMFVNQNSDISLIHGISAYKKNHKVYMRDTQGEKTIDFIDWHWYGGRILVNLYRSDRP